VGTVQPKTSFFGSAIEVVKSVGVVFGDIGTSPLYTLGDGIFRMFLLTASADNIMGAVSLLIWTLIVLVTVEYSWLAMSLSKGGEGGIVVLKEILTPLLTSPRQVMIISVLAFMGISWFFSDGIITPAVSILSAVGGLRLLPMWAGLEQSTLMVIASCITIGLFFFQRHGTEKISIAFGPIMMVWFISLGIFGVLAIAQAPLILQVINPVYAISFLVHHGFEGFLILSGAILCATGGEALYADMGHLGRTPIRRAWAFVFIMLILNYLGQGAFLLGHPGEAHTPSILYTMVSALSSLSVYTAFLCLSLCAVVIACQALISGMFSIAYQAMMTNIMPMFKIDYTSSRLRSQIYVGSINWAMMLAVLVVILRFKTSEALTMAYGFAVAGTMTITALFMVLIFWHQRKYFKLCISSGVLFCVLAFFLASSFKLPSRGLLTLLIDVTPFVFFLVYFFGQRALYRVQAKEPLDEFIRDFFLRFKNLPKLKGTAVYFVRDLKLISPYVMQTMFKNHILYDDNVLISVVTRDHPFGIKSTFKEDLAPGLRILEIRAGYMDMLDIEKQLSLNGITPIVIFYGVTEIITKKPAWKIFSLIRHEAPTFVQFYKLPPDKLHGVITSVEL
jgi:KUP system potassium uptake protein